MYRNDFLDDMEYIDGITIIDEKGTILFSVKFNPDLNDNAKEEEEIIGKNLFEVFTNLTGDNSTLMAAIALEKIIRKKKQVLHNFNGTYEDTMNISIPIRSNQKTVGAIELSKSLLPGKLENPKYRFLKAEMLHDSREIQGFSGNQARYTLDDIISSSDKIMEIKRQILDSANSSSSVFIHGETGTGKELFAHGIHNISPRRDKPFIPVNCGAIPEGLLESMLFGTKEGSFTGAKDAPGLFEIAKEGTIFLDELNAMPIYLQAKLLRVLEDGRIRRIGGTEEKNFNVRVISSSNIPIEECLRKGIIREDIYYRLCVFHINIPPLRERKGDIGLLLDYFISRYNRYLQKNIEALSNEAYEAILNYDWPGNVRELRHFIEYIMNLADPNEKILSVHHFKDKLRELEKIHSSGVFELPLQAKALSPQIEALEKQQIQIALKESKGVVSKAAKILDIPRQTLQNKMNKYDIRS